MPEVGVRLVNFTVVDGMNPSGLGRVTLFVGAFGHVQKRNGMGYPGPFDCEMVTSSKKRSKCSVSHDTFVPDDILERGERAFIQSSFQNGWNVVIKREDDDFIRMSQEIRHGMSF